MVFFVGKNFKQVPFQNGDDIIMNVDAQNFYESISFSGKGAEVIAIYEKFLNENSILYHEEGFFDVSETNFSNRINNHLAKYDSLLKSSSLDSTYFSALKKKMKNSLAIFYKFHEENTYIRKELSKGKASPKFMNLTNEKGDKISLDDLKGKFVYINFWGTYCGPCIEEIPSLNKLVTTYENIVFVNISSEDERSLKSWKNFIIETKFKGIQLYTNFRKDPFIKEYRVSSVPRYVLIDPAGNIVDAKTYSPSDPKLTTLLSSLKL